MYIYTYMYAVCVCICSWWITELSFQNGGQMTSRTSSSHPKALCLTTISIQRQRSLCRGPKWSPSLNLMPKFHSKYVHLCGYVYMHD